MLDLVGITFSGVVMLVIILRAIQLDRTLPWFEPVKSRTNPPGDTNPGPRQAEPAGGKPGWRRRA
jgi:hypothetical protein